MSTCILITCMLFGNSLWFGMRVYWKHICYDFLLCLTLCRPSLTICTVVANPFWMRKSLTVVYFFWVIHSCISHLDWSAQPMWCLEANKLSCVATER
jgi:hypothetical protein